MTFPRTHGGAVVELLSAVDLLSCCQCRDCFAVGGTSSLRPARNVALSALGWSVGTLFRRGTPAGTGLIYPLGQKQSHSSIRPGTCVPN